jgi:hypothetical protein
MRLLAPHTSLVGLRRATSVNACNFVRDPTRLGCAVNGRLTTG